MVMAPTTQNIEAFTRDNGYYYNNDTGFVGQIVEANGKIFVVFRGSDLSSGFGDAISAFFSDPEPGGDASTVDAQDWSDNHKLGTGTIEYTQLDDALALLRYAKANSGGQEIVVTGQSLGGGLAVLATAIESQREIQNTDTPDQLVKAYAIAAAPFNQQLAVEASLLALEKEGIALSNIRGDLGAAWLPIIDMPGRYSRRGPITRR